MKTVWLTIFAIVSAATCLASCDCVQKVKGIVVDKATGKPLANVLIKKQNGFEHEMQTDSTGEFELSGISGGLFGCPAMDISAFKPEYKIATASVPAGGEIKIELAR